MYFESSKYVQSILWWNTEIDCGTLEYIFRMQHSYLYLPTIQQCNIWLMRTRVMFAFTHNIILLKYINVTRWLHKKKKEKYTNNKLYNIILLTARWSGIIFLQMSNWAFLCIIHYNNIWVDYRRVFSIPTYSYIKNY